MKLNQITSALAQQKASLLSKQTLLTSALLAFAAPALAAEAPAEEAATVEPAEDIERIQVSGMRATMSRSLDEKRTNSAVVDAIAAADFGDLPGLSISEVIENITSVSGHRGKGSSTETSIRGMGPFLGYSTFNGRTVTSAGYTRAVNFKKFPSELVNKVVVYKSQQADIVEGGVAGTIALSSLRPIDYGKSKTSMEVTGVYNSHTARMNDESGLGSKFTFSTIQQFESDKLGSMGFTFGVVLSDDSNPEETFKNSSSMWGCGTRLADGSAASSSTSYDCEDMPSKVGLIDPDTGDTYESNEDFRNLYYDGVYDTDSIFYSSSSYTWRTMEEEDTRKAVVGTFQWIPNDNWDINLDVEWSSRKYWEDRHDLVLQSARRALDWDTLVVSDSGNVLYREGQSKFETQGYYRDQVERYNGFGFNVAHYVGDNWKFELDLAYSRSARNRTSFKSRMQTGDYWNYSLDGTENRMYDLKFLDANGLSSDEDGYDSSTAFDPTNNESWGLDYNSNTSRGRYEREMDDRWDTHKAVAFDVDYLVDGDIISSIKAGVRYSKQHLTNEMDDDTALANPLYNLDGSANLDSDGNQYEISDDNRTSLNADYQIEDDDYNDYMIENCFVDWNNDRWMNSESGEGVEGGRWASFDGKCGFGVMSGVNSDLSFSDIGHWDDPRSAADDDIREDVTAIYVMANIDTEMFDMNVTGNAGLRVVKTEVESNGWRDTYTVSVDEETGYYDSLSANSDLEQVTIKNDVTEFLPSANLTFHLSDELLLRAALYRSLSRPNLQSMGAGRSVDLVDDSDSENTSISDLIEEVTGDNPNLEPIMSWNGDISVEWYPSTDTSLSAAVYYKHFEASFENTVLDEYLTVYEDGESTEVQVDVATTTIGDDTSSLYGLEIGFQHNFANLPGLWSGLGVKASYNWADSDFETEDANFGQSYDSYGNLQYEGLIDPANIWGFSEHVFSGSVYWEYEDFMVRLLYKVRSDYFQPSGDSSYSNRFTEGFEYMDMNMKYKFTSNTSMSFKILNMLDEAQYMTDVVGGTSLISSSGPKYFLSLKHKF